MDIKRINELMSEAKWTDMLRELPVGVHTLSFPNVEAIKSCKAIAYSINSDRRGRRYTFNVDKAELVAVITVNEVV